MCQVSRVMCQVAHVRCHMSHLFFYFFIFFQSGGAIRWRVCYQWGLPRLVYQYFSKPSRCQQVMDTKKTKLLEQP